MVPLPEVTTVHVDITALGTEGFGEANDGPGYWWVNQNQTYAEEVSGEFLWSPKAKANGSRNPFYEFMTAVRTGDVVFCFCDTFIKAVGVAKGPAVSAPKPDFNGAGANWSDVGWLVPVEFTELARPVRPKNFIDKILPHLPPQYSPLLPNGNGLQSVYITHVPSRLAQVLCELIGPEFDAIADVAQNIREELLLADVLSSIESRQDIGPTTKEQLIKARRGQGIFRTKVRRVEQRCRVTGVTDPRNLKASHIKPWKDCSDFEKLSGYNGLLLAPHVDHLFDRGWISFTDEGDLLISPALDRFVLMCWGIPEVLNVGPFEKQANFLAYHRAHVFKPKRS
jgi:hypothetical protein